MNLVVTSLSHDLIAYIRLNVCTQKTVHSVLCFVTNDTSGETYFKAGERKSQCL